MFFTTYALLGGAARPAAAAQHGIQQHATQHGVRDWLRLDITGMDPRLATTDDATLTISGTVTNTSDRTISDLVARVQTGERQTSESELASTLASPPPTDVGTSEWVGIADTLGPGQSAPVSITAPLAALGLSQPGVYQVLVNVNGTPAYGGAARLATIEALLPIIDPRGGTDTPPAQVSVLWPIAASKPSVVAAPYDGPVVLADDRLAADLAPGGRLDALVSTAAGHRGDPMFGSLCFAVDPDLLETVEAMSHGYQVRTPGGTVPGTGQDHATRWLDALRKLVAGHCVIQIPYADADLSTLARVSSTADLVGDAVNNGAAILNVLHTGSRPGVLWQDGTLDSTALKAASDVGTGVVITDPRILGMNADAGITAVSGTDTRVLPVDPVVADALSGTGGNALPTEQPGVATQNGIAAVAFHAQLGKAAGPVVVAPPHDWSAPPAELDTLLAALGELEAARLLKPTPLPDLIDAKPGSAPANDVDITNLATESTTPDRVITALSEVESTAADLQNAMSVDATRQVEPISLIQPVHNAVLRATSTAWQHASARDAATAAARNHVTTLQNQVTVATPSQPVSLASGSSPLPVTLSNALPVAVTVRIQLGNIAGLRPSRIGNTTLAAGSRVGMLIPAEALRSGRFNVEVSLTTPSDTRLGSPARLELTSNEFGSLTVVLTATAGVALVLLSGRRIYRRVKERNKQERSS